MNLLIEQAQCTAFKRYGQNRNGTVNAEPDSIEIHSIGTAQDEADKIRNNMNQYNPSGIVHAIVDTSKEGRVIELLPYKNVAWADAGYGNQHSFTIEMSESDYMRYTSGANFTITNKEKFFADINRGYSVMVEYVAKKCKEFNLNPLDKLSNGLYKVYSHQEANQKGLASAHVDPSHVWSKIGKDMDTFRKEVKAVMDGAAPSVVLTDTVKTYTYSDSMTKNEFIEAVGSIAKALAAKTGILASVVTAQACLESGFGLGSDAIELTKRHNILGMKSELLSSTWSEFSVWNGNSYRKKTPEVYSGKTTYIYDNFRVYDSFNQCLEDYEMFLLHVKANGKLKYADIAGWTDPTKVITAISQRGYATDPSYITKVMNIINTYGLTKFDGDEAIVAASEPEEKDVYFVRNKEGKQLNSFHILENAKKNADDNPGYEVYDESGKVIYTPAVKQTTSTLQRLFVGKVNVRTKLNVRTGPGAAYTNIPGYPYLLNGNLVDVLKSVKGDDKATWYYIRIADKYYGYVSGAFIKKA